MRKILVGTVVCLTGLTAFLAGCGGEKAAVAGDTVRIAYVGSLDDGSVFDSTNTGDYIEFTIGDGQIIAGLDNAVIGMKQGEEKVITLSSDEAYGPHRMELTHDLPMSDFPDSVKPEVGLTLNMTQPDGRQVPIRITGIKDDTMVTLDANHPMAGKTLHFKVTMVEILPKEE